MNVSDQWKVFMDARESAPVDVWRIPGQLGIEARKAFLPHDISGMLERSESGFHITVEARDPNSRQRFTLAHELGHFMFHRHLIGVGEGVDDDRVYRSTEAGKYHNTNIGPDEETEANKFAAALLMPMELVDHHRKELGDDVEEMAQLFQVSKHSMAIRMGVPYREANI